MLLIFSMILLTHSSTISSSYILNDSIDQDDFSLDIFVTSDTSITNLKIIFFGCSFSSNAQVTLKTSSVQYQDVYIFTIDIQQNTINIEQNVNDFILLAYQLNFRIGQFIYPTIDTTFQYYLLLNKDSANSETKSLNRVARQLTFLSTTIQSSETSNQNTFTIEYQPNFQNYDYNVISLEFVSQYSFPLQFFKCQGVQNYAQDAICWSKDNFLYIQQQSQTFQSNDNKGKVIIEIINFVNPYYIGTFNVNFLLKHKNYLQNDYYSSFASSSITINQQRNSPLLISHQNQQINQTSQVTLNFNVQIFNQFLLVDLTIPNQKQENYLIQCDDANIIIKDVKYQNYNNQILTLQASQSLEDYNIMLKINNFQNFEIPVSQSFQYTVKEVFDSDTNQLKMQNGKGKISFIQNDILIKDIECSSYYLNDLINVTITLQSDIVINKFAIISLQFNNQLNLNNIKIQSNQISAEGGLTIYNLFDGQSKQQKIQVYNIQNPPTPTSFNFLDLQIYYKNYLIASNTNQVAVNIISGKLDVLTATLYNLINNSFTTLIISLEFNIVHPYISNLVLLFDTSNINFDQLTKELQCSLDEINYQCQIFMDKLTIFSIQLEKQKYEIKIQYFPYPRSNQPLIIKQIQQINSTIILTQSQNSFSINTDYYRRFQDFKVSPQQIAQLEQNIALNLVIIPSQIIMQNEYLNLYYNGYLEISQNSQCQININTVQIQCEFNPDFIKVVIINGQLNYNYNYNLILSNVKILKNFISLNLIAFTQNQYTQQYSTCQFTIDQTEQSSQFPQFSFDPKDLVLYETSEYFLFFENSKTIPQNGYLELQMEDLNIDFLQGEVVGVSGYEAIKNTQIYRTKNTFGLRFYFQNEIQSGIHLIQLVNITNPSFNKVLDSYTFYLYSYDSQNSMLEYQEYDLMINFTCPISNCSICNQPNFCDKCVSTQITYQGQCIDACPDGTVLINDSCQKCNTPSSCLQCSEQDTVLCKVCSDGYTLINGFCKWIIDTVNDSQTNDTHSNNTHYQNNSNTYEQQKNGNTLSQKSKIYDVNIFAIIVLSISILFISRSIFRKQTDFNNALIAISGLADISLQFMLFIIILINYNFGQSILALSLIFISIIQQGFAFSTLKFHTSMDVNYYINLAQYKVTRFFRFASLCLDWKVIFIHKSCLTDSPVFNIKFKDELRFGRIFKFLFQIKICINILNLLMLGIILLSQFQIAQLIYESICYNFALIFMQLNKIYEINQYLKNTTTKNYFQRQLSDQNHNQEETKAQTAKVTPECIIIKNSDQI